MSRSWDDDPRMRRIRRDDYDDYGMNPDRSGAVTAIGVIAIVYGGILVLFGLCFLFCGLMFNAAPMFAGTNMSAAFILLAVVLLGVSLGHIFGGIFLIQRKNAARVFMLVLAGVDFVLGILNIASLIFIFSQPQGPMNRNGDQVVLVVSQILMLLVNWGYSTFAFLVLLNGRNAEEFT